MAQKHDKPGAVTSKGNEPGKRTDDKAGATPEGTGDSGGKKQDGGE